jgi:hypothetical protein
MGDTQLGEFNEKEMLDASLFLKSLLRVHAMSAGYVHKRLDRPFICRFMYPLIVIAAVLHIVPYIFIAGCKAGIVQCEAV